MFIDKRSPRQKKNAILQKAEIRENDGKANGGSEGHTAMTRSLHERLLPHLLFGTRNGVGNHKAKIVLRVVAKNKHTLHVRLNK